MYTLSYYLPLPQSFQALDLPVQTSNGTIFPPSAPSSNAADALDADIFSPSSGSKNLKPVSYLEQDSQATSINQQFDKESTEPGTDKEGGESDEETSNDSFSYSKIFQSTPKAANLMRARQPGKGGKSCMVFTYHEDIGVLDTQEIFDSVMANGHDMYELQAGLSGLPTVEDRIGILDRLKAVINVI